MTNWEDIHPNFTSKLQKDWEERGFSREQTKKWIDIGLKVEDGDYAQWLNNIEDIREKDAGWILNYRTEFINSRLSSEVIEQIKDFDYHEESTSSTDMFIVSILITNEKNEKLKKRWEKFGLCKECKQPQTAYDSPDNWCQFCNALKFAQDFKNWTSGNDEIDKFIRESQLKATSWREVIKWVPYDEFKDIWAINNNFGDDNIYKAYWENQKIFNWSATDDERKEWKECQSPMKTVILKKILNNSENAITELLQEVGYYNLFSSNACIINCYGISQDPETNDYMIIMNYAENGNLSQFVQNNRGNLRFKIKLDYSYYILGGLNEIHQKELIHGKLHSYNILIGKTISIASLGLCRPAKKIDKSKIYGVLTPYVAPEILQGNSYTQTADIYSFGIIAYELFSGLSPYHEYSNLSDEELKIKICSGSRPNLDDINKGPKFFKDWIEKCWDSDPSKRPTASKLRDNLTELDEAIITINKWQEDSENSEWNADYFEFYLNDLIIQENPEEEGSFQIVIPPKSN